MRKAAAFSLVCVVAGLAFVAGSWVTWHMSARGREPGRARTVLYWVDPMHPSYKSDKPGIAPDCGMQLEPVYADERSAVGGRVLPPNAIQVSVDRQQLIGVRLGHAEPAPTARTATTVGRVAVDETRVFRVATGVDGLVHDVAPVSTTNLVHKDELLLRITARDILTAEQSFFYGLAAVERYQKEGSAGPDQMKIAEAQVKSGADSLAAYGVGARQIEDLRRTRVPTTDVDIRSPVTGFVLSRTVFSNQRYDRGAELFRMADLRRVWVLADVFANEATALRPGMAVRLILPYGGGRRLHGRVANALPAFDTASRTFKVRIEVDNPDYLLRPDMFVDVQFDVALSPGLTVPADAVVDSGARATVFVDRGNGYFEPRTVETGWRDGNRVQVLSGLTETDAIVVSGNFLLDSESRMRAATTGVNPATSQIDPVCGMSVDPERARGAGQTLSHAGRMYYFCSRQCRERFETNPGSYTSEHDHLLPSSAPRQVDGSRRSPPIGRKTEPASTAPAGMAQQDTVDAGIGAPANAVMMAQEKETERPAAFDHQQYAPKNRLLRRSHVGASSSMVEAKADSVASAGIAEDNVQLDVACAAIVNKMEASSKGLFAVYKDKTYYFSNADCKTRFDKEPEKFIGR
ncbi:MAG TPA: efflux RND transporter periplasmic adaptor subunit [Vicinamibacterales bacterium]|jgi:RND family efflux transporter MFP subunit